MYPEIRQSLRLGREELEESLRLGSKTIQQPLPHCLPTLLPTLKRLHTLVLGGATAETLTATLQALAATSTTLRVLSLRRSKFNFESMQLLCLVLPSHSKSMIRLVLDNCKVSDEEVQILTTVLHRLKRLDLLSLEGNDIHESGLAIAEAMLGHTTSCDIAVNLQGNPISASGHKALDEFRETNNAWWWLAY